MATLSRVAESDITEVTSHAHHISSSREIFSHYFLRWNFFHFLSFFSPSGIPVMKRIAPLDNPEVPEAILTLFHSFFVVVDPLIEWILLLLPSSLLTFFSASSSLFVSPSIEYFSIAIWLDKKFTWQFWLNFHLVTKISNELLVNPILCSRCDFSLVFPCISSLLKFSHCPSISLNFSEHLYDSYFEFFIR